jgi:hypothetical protein
LPDVAEAFATARMGNKKTADAAIGGVLLIGF